MPSCFVLAADAPAVVPDPSMMLPLVPGAATAGPPPVIKTGTRIMYFGMTASIPGEYKRLVQDDNGRWVDPNTGKRYDEEDVAGSAAAAYTVLNVGALDNQVVEFSQKTYLVNTTTRTAGFAFGAGLVAHSGCAADWWIHPAALKKVQEVNRGGLRILRMPYNLNNRRYNAIRFQTEDANGYNARVYDLDTGLLIYHGSRAQGPDIITPPGLGGGAAGRGQGSTQTVVVWLVEIKDIDIPWKNAATPAWVQRFRQLEFHGTQTADVPAAGTHLDRPMVMVITPKATGPNWLRWASLTTIQSFQGMPPEQSAGEGGCSSASIGGLWIAPESLATLRLGQVIEQNDVLNTKVTITQAGSGSVALTESGPVHRVTFTYDLRTGMATAIDMTQQIGLATISHRLRLTGQK